jgi:hypothetical protein
MYDYIGKKFDFHRSPFRGFETTWDALVPVAPRLVARRNIGIGELLAYP